MHDEEYDEVTHLYDDRYAIPDKIVFGVEGLRTNVINIDGKEYKINSSHQTKSHFYATLLRRAENE